MAQTKTRSKPKAKSKPKTRASSKPKKARSSSSTSARKPRTSSNRSKANSTSKPKGLVDKTKAAGETVEETAKDAGRKVGRVAGKAKVPLVAGGAALAGAAGGMAALSARQNHRHRGLGGVNSKDLKKAAKKAGDVGAQVGEIALEVRRARERTNGHGAHRSPIEVVLQGLTSRRPKE
jgi:hypothetical protein